MVGAVAKSTLSGRAWYGHDRWNRNVSNRYYSNQNWRLANDGSKCMPMSAAKGISEANLGNWQTGQETLQKIDALPNTY